MWVDFSSFASFVLDGSVCVCVCVSWVWQERNQLKYSFIGNMLSDTVIPLKWNFRKHPNPKHCRRSKTSWYTHIQLWQTFQDWVAYFSLDSKGRVELDLHDPCFSECSSPSPKCDLKMYCKANLSTTITSSTTTGSQPLMNSWQSNLPSIYDPLLNGVHDYIN